MTQSCSCTMMSKEVTAAEILQGLSKESLDSQVSEEHIAEIARQMKTWELYMPDLLREDAEAEEEEIKHDDKNNYGLQKLEALRRWKRKFGSSATYRRLIVVFCKVKQADLAEKVKQLLVASSSNAESAFSTGILAEYREYLVSCYTESPHPSCLGWPEAVAETYIDLPLTEVPPQPKQPNEPDKGPRKKVVLGELFKTRKSDCKRKVILVEGPAGCGKTTLIWHACREWAAGSRLFPNINLLIRLSLDDPSLHSARSLADLIPHESSEMREVVANNVARLSGKGVCFLLDAWDEAPPSVQRKGSYVHRFISGDSAKALPHCSIITTSRPVAAGLLYPLLTARVVVGGFNRAKVAQFAVASLGHHDAAKKELDEAFRINPCLLGLCNLPINAAIVLYLLQLQTPCSKLPSTQTGLFYALALNLLLRHMRLRTTHGLVEIDEFEDMPESVVRMFKSVCTLAFHGVIESKTQFVLKDLKALSIDPPLDTLGLLQAPRQLTERGPQHSYTFLHYAVQEFLAAYHISKLTSEEQSKEVSQILHNKPLSLVLPFYAGLTKLSNSSVCSILTEVTKKALDIESVMASMTQNPDSESSDSRKPLLALMNCIYESQNKDICRLVNFINVSDSADSYVSFSGLALDPMDCISLGYFFANKHLDKVCGIGLETCHVGDTGIEVLMKELSKGCMAKDAKGIILMLTGSDCSHRGVECISETMSQAPILWGLSFGGWISYGFNATASLTYLTKGLCRSTRCRCICLQACVSYKHTYHLILLIAFGNLQTLDLTNNDIGSSSVMSLLGQSLKLSRTLMELLMNNCNISDGGLQHLGSVLHDNESITCLCIPNNPFSSKAFSSFLEILCTANVHSRLQKLQLEPQRCKTEHECILRTNMYRLRSDMPPLKILECKEIPDKLIKSFTSLPNSLSMHKHY